MTKESFYSLVLYRHQITMNIRLLLLLLTLLSANFSISAQKKIPKQVRLEIEDYLVAENYEKAQLIIDQQLIDLGSTPWLDLKKGICLLNSDGKVDEAIALLQQVADTLSLDVKKNHDAIEARFYLGQALHLGGYFEKAKAEFETLQNHLTPKQADMLLVVNREIDYCNNAIELAKHPVAFRVSNLGASVNNRFEEHSPVVSADETTLIFTSNRPGAYRDSTFLQEDIYVSEFRGNQWTDAQRIGTFENKKGANASVSLTADGKTILIYQFDGLSGDILISRQTVNGWTKPEKLPEPINTKYDEKHASFSFDEQTLYFSSNRPGGFGLSDIYFVRLLPDGNWGRVVNMGPAINTAGDEDSPYIHPDDHTLYFASTEHNSIGGFDIFKTERTDSVNWSVPQNIGYPINTPDDDLFFNPTVDGMRVYFASRRAGGFGKSDIYLMEFDENDPRVLAVVAGYAFNQYQQPTSEVNISVYDASTNDLMGVYRPNPITGKYVMILPSGKKILIRYQGPTDEKESIIEVPLHSNFTSGSWAHYLEPVTIQVP